MESNNNHIILVIDDDNTHLDAVINCFRDKSYRIIYAPNGEKGYDLAVKEIPDLVIMDWAMPVMNGIDTTLKLKATESTKHIPIVMATGVMTNSEDLKKALEAGAVDYLRKPFDQLELSSRVNAAMILSHSFQKIQRQNQEIQEFFIKEKILLQEQIDHKERELSIKALYIQEKIQILNEIKDGLKKLNKENDLNGNDTFKQLYKKTKEALQNGKRSDNFLFHFENVHPNFFDLVKNRAHKELTSNELKLTAYIKIGMNNKEIAQMGGVELGTVKSNINRLKKKIGIPAEESLRKFITSL